MSARVVPARINPTVFLDAEEKSSAFNFICWLMGHSHPVWKIDEETKKLWTVCPRCGAQKRALTDTKVSQLENV